MIDAVVTWVDGDDPAHADKRRRFAGGAVHPNARSSTRFASRGEIRYNVWSILSFCPFVDRVFIVTDAQTPRALEVLFADRPDWRDRVRIVDHRDLYREHADLLPVFSSRSIETMLFRTPDLAEHFLYLNDDIFIGRPVAEDLFFQKGQPVLQGRLHRFPNPVLARLKAWVKPGPARAGFKDAQQRAARLVGVRDRYFLAEHRPHPMRRSTFERFFDAHPDLLRAQAAPRFRSADQFSPIGLAHHLELGAGAKVVPPSPSGYLKPTSRPDKRKAVLEALRQGRLDTVCIQSLDAMAPADQDAVVAALDAWVAAGSTA
ncbi:Stealth CR1 domain-containing protein [Falsirhodobacter sp. 20TX0035]|uniref:Stealth CR1 domain-containing protein n=1 Tax=Falsirhodobacter sp. 20TX0035 TaxID=3022019 RepID=UPI00232C1DBD|nr:Stealth CR1 domain-containing protein [Falsirhodobacter sp. 20TX0035]MDB6453730.1 Stealth CR1 domain-containing protein [Falsirhodobacter sp. 20TX0035]